MLHFTSSLRCTVTYSTGRAALLCIFPGAEAELLDLLPA